MLLSRRLVLAWSALPSSLLFLFLPSILLRLLSRGRLTLPARGVKRTLLGLSQLKDAHRDLEGRRRASFSEKMTLGSSRDSGLITHQVPHSQRVHACKCYSYLSTYIPLVFQDMSLWLAIRLALSLCPSPYVCISLQTVHHTTEDKALGLWKVLRPWADWEEVFDLSSSALPRLPVFLFSRLLKTCTAHSLRLLGSRHATGAWHGLRLCTSSPCHSPHALADRQRRCMLLRTLDLYRNLWIQPRRGTCISCVRIYLLSVFMARAIDCLLEDEKDVFLRVTLTVEGTR